MSTHKNRYISAMVLSVILCLMLPGHVIADGATKIILGTATKGGGFQLFGQNQSEVINETDKSLHIDAIATKGSRQNLPFLEEGKVDIGQV